MDGSLILEHIVSSGILDDYRLRDSDLDGLIARLSKSLSNWQGFRNIYVSDQNVPAAKIEPTFERRLRTMPDQKQLSNPDEKLHFQQLRSSLIQFLKYLGSHPQVEITFATFNCARHSYDVQCGIIDQKVDVVCVLEGPHIPDELLPK